jgi:hypothetical protein
MFTLEGIRFYLSEKSYGYSSSGDWGRIGGIEKANAMFFRDDLNMLGFGLGSCNYGTSFYYVYGYREGLSPLAVKTIRKRFTGADAEFLCYRGTTAVKEFDPYQLILT